MIKLISLFMMIHGASADVYMMPTEATVSGDTYVMVNTNQLLNNKSISYTAGTAANWNGSPPTTIQQAIDRMATKVKALNSNVAIP